MVIVTSLVPLVEEKNTSVLCPFNFTYMIHYFQPMHDELCVYSIKISIMLLSLILYSYSFLM